MIKFILHKARRDYAVNGFTLKKGDTILKILFDEKDVHKSNSGKLHLDIWGQKLIKLATLRRGAHP